ncbi:MAG: HEAT repeat domain-containing protein [Ignavibacteriales bacterium]|nr:HEAT repeat domain-containing protein [Ignavibacteriales bacterium]
MVCPWNRFAAEGDPAFEPKCPASLPDRGTGLSRLEPLTNASSGLPSSAPNDAATCVTSPSALGNTADMHALPVLQNALNDEEPMIREHAGWAIDKIKSGSKGDLATDRKLDT